MITDVEKKRKFVCVDVHDIPDVAIVDPDMMLSMPESLTAATGMDAMTHAIEGYTTAAAWQMTDDVGIPAKLDKLKEEDLDFLAQSAAADACAPGDPKPATVEDFKALFRKIM